MKKEILRIHNLNIKYSDTAKLVNISMCLSAGEKVGFLGLDNSGKDQVVDILCGRLGVEASSFWFFGKNMLNMKNIEESVYKMADSNYIFDDWTVAEYLDKISEHFYLGFYRRKKLVNKAEEYMDRLGLKIAADKKLKNLTSLEKRILDLVKAYSRKAKILIINSEFEGCSKQEILQFKQILNKVIKDEMVVIVNCYSDNVLHILSDRYIIFKKGYIVKKCKREYIQDSEHLEKFLLGTDIISRKKHLENYKYENSFTREIVYQISNMTLKEKRGIHFEFFKGEVVTILVSDLEAKKNIFDLLSGRKIEKSMKLFLENELFESDSILDFVGRKIVSVMELGDKSELLLGMSAAENLLVPSLVKIPILEYMFTGRKLLYMLKKEVRANMVENGDDVRNMNTGDCIILQLERWYIFKPKVLILFEPFIHCDIFSVSLVKAYIKKFTELGTVVVLVKSREEHSKDISSRIIKI